MKVEGFKMADLGQSNKEDALTKEQEIKEMTSSILWTPSAQVSGGQGMICDVYEQPKSIEDVVSDVQGQDLLDNTSMNYVADTMTSSEYRQARKDGFSLLKDQPETVITVTDKIQIQLAKGKGSTISSDIPLEAIEEVVGSLAVARSIEDTLQDLGLTLTENNQQNFVNAITMAKEVASQGDYLSKGAIAYLLENNLAPSIENLYQATFSAARRSSPSMEISSELQGLIEDVVAQSDREDGQALEDAQWMLQENLPLTKENLSYVKELRQTPVYQMLSQVLEGGASAIARGEEPKQALLFQTKDLALQAEEALDVVTNAKESQILYLQKTGQEVTIENLKRLQQGEDAAYEEDSYTEYDQVKARRQLEEIRLSMTLEANYSLLKRGIQIETEPLEQLVDQLKEVEDALAAKKLTSYGLAGNKDQVAIYQDTSRALDQVRYASASILGKKEILTSSLEEFAQSAARENRRYEQASNQYEKVMTQPRADLGDSITKAFANVDDILQDLGLDRSEDNARAVRILGYNSMEITTSSIADVKMTDAKVQLMLEQMKPAVVMDFIKEGINPLTMTVDEINTKAQEILDQTELTTQEKYGEYLWKLDQKGDLSQEQRESYLGIYRLLHQISLEDGRLTGALLQQGAAFTMENYLMASRSLKKQGMEVTIHENFGQVEVEGSLKNSISSQIQSAYESLESKRAMHALQELGPNALSQVEDPMSLTPSQLLDQLKKAKSQEETMDQSYEAMQLEEAQSCAQMEEGVYRLLDGLDLPKNIYNLQAAHLYSKRNGKIFSDLFEKSTDLSQDMQAVKDQLIEEFGEAMKTPEDMAKAQEHLADVAEEVMSQEMEREDATFLSLRQIKILNQAIKLAGKLSSQEDYAVPVLINGQMTRVQLKIVRATEEKGRVAISFAQEAFGQVTASFQVTDQQVSGYVALQSKEGKEELEERIKAFEQSLDQESQIQTILAPEMDSEQILSSLGENKLELKGEEVLSSLLYDLAKNFLQAMKG